ncbi:MAG: THUMP domain-containing class I SAM-dependent RNA methyltransferase [Planctomycetota bacterium]
MSQRDIFFATCAPGLEPVLHQELRDLKMGRVERQVGGVRFEGRLEDAWRANLALGTAVRVLWRRDRFPAPDADRLYTGVQRLPWEELLSPEGSLRVDAQVRDSSLTHSQFVAQRAKDAIVDRFRKHSGRRPSVDKDDPDLIVNLHVTRDRATLSIDTSGVSLHKRGWRRFQGRAPLAETLAAGCVHLSRWDQRSPLVDPLCGSGTLLIEAALQALGRAPGLNRSFAFERFPGHDARRCARLRDELRQAERPAGKRRLMGVEQNPERAAGAQENVASAGLEGLVEIEHGSFFDLDLRRGWNAQVLSNLPYGERVGKRKDLEYLYRTLGEKARTRWQGYGLALLMGDKHLTKLLALKPAERTALKNGGLDVELVRYELG